MLYQICGALFSLSLLAACGLEAQEECLPCAGNKLRQAELFLEGPAPVSGLETPLHVFRRAAGTQDGYVLDRTYASVADGEVLKLPLAELRNSDYRFLMVARPGGGEWFSLGTAAGTPFVPGVAWEDLRLECAAGAAAAEGYCGFTDLSGEVLLRDGSIRLTLTRIAGQVLFDIFRTGGSLSQPESVVSSDVESVIDRVARIEAGALGHIADAGLQVLTGGGLEGDRAAGAAHLSENALEERTFARAVGADQCDQLAAVHVEIDVIENGVVAPDHSQILHLETAGAVTAGRAVVVFDGFCH